MSEWYALRPVHEPRVREREAERRPAPDPEPDPAPAEETGEDE